MIPTDTIDKLEATWFAVSTLGGSLTETQWKLPTDLPGWTVQDNIAHLIGTERMLQGLPGTDHRAATADHVKNPLGQANEHEIDCRRHLSGAKVLAEWNDLVALRLATLRGADDAYFAQEASTPTGPGTVADFLHIRVLDSWAHEQDIRRAIERPGGFDNDAAAHTLDRLTRTLPIVVGKRGGTPEGAAVRFLITGPVGRDLTYEVIGGRATLVDAPSATPVVTILLDSEAFAVLALGRQTADQLAGRVEITGDAELAGRMLAGLSMMI